VRAQAVRPDGRRAQPGAPRRRTQVERRATTRRKLLAAAVHLICKSGFAFATTSEIAAAAGVTRGAIQHHFRGRTELVQAILEDLEAKILGSFEEAVPTSGSDLANRIDLLLDHLASVARSESYLAVMNIWTVARYDPELRGHVHRSLLRAWRRYKEFWRRAFDDVPEAVVADCRRMVVAVLRGLALSRMLDGTPRSLVLTLETCKTMVNQHMRSGCAERQRNKRATRR
jgi:AcrR family transcriptional regulator